jgi:hypothetical protein
MTRLTDPELAVLDPVIAARKAAPDFADKKYVNEITPNNNSSIALMGDRTGLTSGEGLSVEALMKAREDSFR